MIKMSYDSISFYGSDCEDGLFGSFYVEGKDNLIDIFSLLESLSIEEQKSLILRIRNNIKRLARLKRDENRR